MFFKFLQKIQFASSPGSTLKIRSLTYVAAVLSALGILTVALSIAFFVWWRRVSCALR